MIVQQTVRQVALALLIGACLPVAALAQDEGGLTLGQDENPEPKLDLGARPAEPEAQQEQSGETDGAPADQPANTPATGQQQAPSIGTTRGPQGQAPSPDELEQFGDWEVYCPDAGGECLMAQLGSDAAGSRVLEMNIRKLPEPLEVENEVAVAVLDVIVPLGVVLTAGLSIAIDEAEPQFAPYQICLEQGCLVREPIAQELVDRFLKGGKATVTMVGANDGDVVSDISLNGFTAAFGALK